jgi:hypothetical protein
VDKQVFSRKFIEEILAQFIFPVNKKVGVSDEKIFRVLGAGSFLCLTTIGK